MRLSVVILEFIKALSRAFFFMTNDLYDYRSKINELVYIHEQLYMFVIT